MRARFALRFNTLAACIFSGKEEKNRLEREYERERDHSGKGEAGQPGEAPGPWTGDIPHLVQHVRPLLVRPISQCGGAQCGLSSQTG